MVCPHSSTAWPKVTWPIEEGGLGFPINDKVRNQTYVPFSITYFVQMLVNIPGEHNFKLDVTDNEGVTVSKAVQLLTPTR